jgi:hypothetical protein
MNGIRLNGKRMQVVKNIGKVNQNTFPYTVGIQSIADLTDPS